MTADASNKILQFFSKNKPLEYKKGEILIRADDDPSWIFYIIYGNVKKYAISQKGDELVVNVFKPHSFFPMSYALHKTKNEYYFEAITDVKAYKAPVGEVLAYVKENKDVLYDLLTRVYIGTDGLEKRMTYLMAGSAYTRLITELVIQAKRFGIQKDKGLELSLSETDLASYSGMTRETVSREIKHLKDKGLVRFEKSKLYIPEFQRLEEEISGGA